MIFCPDEAVRIDMPNPSSAQEALTYDTLSVITDRLKLLATRRVEMWWDIGCLLDAMATRGFARGVGIRDYASYAEKVVGIERGEARRLRRISSLFSRELCLRFGLEKLELLVQLMESCYEVSPVLDPMRMEVLSERPDGTVQMIPFAESSVDDLRYSIRVMARLPSCGDRRFGPELGALRDALDEALYGSLRRKAPRVKIERDPGKAPGRLALLELHPGAIEAVGRVLVSFGRAMSRAARPRPKPSKPTKRKAKDVKPAKRSAKGSKPAGKTVRKSKSR